MHLSLPDLRLASTAVAPLVLVVALASCAPEPAADPAAERAPAEPTTAPPPEPAIEWALAVHGGAGVIPRDHPDADGYWTSLDEALREGRDRLDDGEAALEVVEAVVRRLEDDPRFNAGRGAVFTNRGTHELDAAIMDGRTLSCGAVTGVKNVRNPITLARRVMERSDHVLLSGNGAEQFSREVGVRRVQQRYFYTQERYDAWRRVVREEREGRIGGDGIATDTGRPSDLDTVGAVALDRYGNLAAATSTGGLTNKRFGRVGDVPLVGAGTYADNRTAAVSCTGRGEEFIRHAVAHEVSALIEHAGLDVEQAARRVVHDRLQQGDGGLIAVGADGKMALAFNTPGMFRGAADSTGRFEVGIWEDMRAAGARPEEATGDSPPGSALTPPSD